MGGSPSKKSNFQECILTQEQIDKIYNNFCEFSKLKDGSSGTYISLRGLQKVVKPNKTLGRKIHEFLAQQSVTQTLNFETFLYFVEFFMQGFTYIRQDLRYREYSIVEMFGLLSFYSNLTKNKQTDKEYINRLPISFRSGLDFFKELHGIIGALNGIYKEERDETIPRRLASLVFGSHYEISFQDFILTVKQQLPNIDKILQSYFRRTFYLNQPYKHDSSDKDKTHEPPKTSQLLNLNTLSNLNLQVSLFSEFPYRENVYNAQQERFNFDSLTKAIQTFGNQSLLLLVSHEVTKKVNPEDDDSLLQRTRINQVSDKEKQTLGVYLPRQKSQSESFIQISPNFQVFSNTTGKENFLIMDQTAIVVFFGEGEEDLLFLHNELNKQSYIKSNNPSLSLNSEQPTVLSIDQMELWVLSDDPIDMTIHRSHKSEVIVQEQYLTSSQPQVTYTTTTPQPGISSSTTTQVSTTKQVVIERNAQQEYYIASTSNPQYYSNVGIKDVK